MPVIYPPFAVGQVRTGAAPIIDPEHPTFGADGTGATDSTTALQAAMTAAGAAGASVHLKAGRSFLTGDITIPAGVTVISDNARILRASYGGADSATITMEDGAEIRGSILIDGRAGSVTGVGSTDAHYAIQATGDDVYIESAEIEGFTSGRCRHIRTRGNRFRLGYLYSDSPSYSSVFVQPGTGSKRDWCHLGQIVSINAAWKGVNYSGATGIGLIRIDRLWATTDTEEAASENLLLDSGDADPTDTDTSVTVRVDRLSVGDFYGVGALSNSMKLQHVGDVQIGTAYCQPSASVSGHSIFAGCPRVSVGELVATRSVRTRGSFRVNLYRYLGSEVRALDVTGLLGQDCWIGRLETNDSTMSGAAIRVFRGDNRRVHVESCDMTSGALFEVPGTNAPTNWVCGSVGRGVLLPHTVTGLTGGTNDQRFDRPPRQVRRAAAPVAGTWERGDIVWNTSPAASGWIGWVCVTAGTPGTWEPFGAIDS